MKTTYLKQLLLATFIGMAGIASSQALTINTSVKNSDNDTTVAYYTLYNSDELLQVGKCSRLTLQLGYNDYYTLTFSKKGHRSKTVTISTFDPNFTQSIVSFDIILEPLTTKGKQPTEFFADQIYYDRYIDGYNSISYEVKSN